MFGKKKPQVAPDEDDAEDSDNVAGPIAIAVDVNEPEPTPTPP